MANSSLKKLNLGCGRYPKDGFINVDVDANSKADVIHNLDEFPYPFEDGQFQEITSSHCLEHLNDPFATMAEIYRIAAPGASITIQVPHFSRGFTHADHKRGFDVSFPFYFNPEFQGGYSGTPLKIERVSLTWYGQPYLKSTVLSPATHRTLMVIGKGLDFFANLSPALCSRIWAFWVGGFEEIEYQFRKSRMSSDDQ